MDWKKKNIKERNLSPATRSNEFDDWFRTPFEELSLTRDVRNWVREVEEVMTQHMEALMRRATSPDKTNHSDGETEPIVYGWSLKVVNGKPEFKEFGNVATDSKVREPFADVLKTAEGYRVTIELPGVEKSEINLETGTTEIFVETVGDRKYKKVVTLPEEIDQSTVASTFKNGVLGVTAKRSNGVKRKVSVL